MPWKQISPTEVEIEPIGYYLWDYGLAGILYELGRKPDEKVKITYDEFADAVFSTMKKLVKNNQISTFGALFKNSGDYFINGMSTKNVKTAKDVMDEFYKKFKKKKSMSKDIENLVFKNEKIKKEIDELIKMGILEMKMSQVIFTPLALLAYFIAGPTGNEVDYITGLPADVEANNSNLLGGYRPHIRSVRTNASKTYISRQTLIMQFFAITHSFDMDVGSVYQLGGEFSKLTGAIYGFIDSISLEKILQLMNSQKRGISIMCETMRNGKDTMRTSVFDLIVHVSKVVRDAFIIRLVANSSQGVNGVVPLEVPSDVVDTIISIKNPAVAKMDSDIAKAIYARLRNPKTSIVHVLRNPAPEVAEAVTKVYNNVFNRNIDEDKLYNVFEKIYYYAQENAKQVKAMRSPQQLIIEVLKSIEDYSDARQFVLDLDNDAPTSEILNYARLVAKKRGDAE